MPKENWNVRAKDRSYAVLKSPKWSVNFCSTAWQSGEFFLHNVKNVQILCRPMGHQDILSPIWHRNSCSFATIDVEVHVHSYPKSDLCKMYMYTAHLSSIQLYRGPRELQNKIQWVRFYFTCRRKRTCIPWWKKHFKWELTPKLDSNSWQNYKMKRTRITRKTRMKTTQDTCPNWRVSTGVL